MVFVLALPHGHFDMLPLDGDTGNMCRPCDQLRLGRLGMAWFVIIDGEGSQDLLAAAVNGGRPAGAQAMLECQIPVFRPERIAFNI